jgi:hypothetical protein
LTNSEGVSPENSIGEIPKKRLIKGVWPQLLRRDLIAEHGGDAHQQALGDRHHRLRRASSTRDALRERMQSRSRCARGSRAQDDLELPGAFGARPTAALRVLPGQTSAHEARGLALGKRLLSVPISAMMTAAVTGPVAGKVNGSSMRGQHHHIGCGEGACGNIVKNSS